MKIKYFRETDTLYIELKAGDIAETRDLDENTQLDLDRSGNIRPMTRVDRPTIGADDGIASSPSSLHLGE